MKKLLMLLFLSISLSTFADSKGDNFTKNYLNFQMNYLSEVISIEKNRKNPDANEIDKFLLCQKNLATFFSFLDGIDDLELEMEEVFLLFSDSKSSKKMNKELKSISTIMKSQDDEFNLFMLMMEMSIGGETDKPPEPFEEISSDSLDIFMGNMFIYEKGCEQDLMSNIEEMEEDLKELGELFDEMDEALGQ